MIKKLFLWLVILICANVFAASWYNASWPYRRAIIIPNSGNPNAMTNIQTSVNLTSLNFSFAKAKSDGSDIRFTNHDGTTLLNYWMQKYSSVSDSAVAWVKVPSIAAGAIDTVYCYYGNAAASAVSSYSNTMQKFASDATTLALYHCDESSGISLTDASGNGYTGTLHDVQFNVSDGGNFAAASQRDSFSTGTSLSFNNDTHNPWVTIPNLLNNVPANGTVEFWFKTERSNANGTRLFTSMNVVNSDLLDLYLNVTGKLCIRKYVSASGVIDSSKASVTDGNWHFLCATWGINGFFYYLDGAIQAFDPNGTAWGNGTYQSLSIGAYYPGTLQFNGDIDEIRLLSRQIPGTEVLADYARRQYTSGIVNWVPQSANPIMSSSQPWEQNATFEPSVIYENSTFKMWYSGGWDSSATGYATSSDGISWTKYSGNPVVGFGHGGVNHSAARNNVIKNNGVYYLFYADLLSSIYVDTSLDGINFYPHGSPTAVLGTTSPENSLQNSSEWVEGSTWYMLYESGVSGHWYTNLATGSGPYSWTKYSGNPLRTLLTGDSSGCGGPWVIPKNGTHNLFYHISPTTSPLPSYMNFATSVDLHTWSQPFYPTLIFSQSNFEREQVADPCVIDSVPATGMSYMYYSGVNNLAHTSAMALATYQGTAISPVTDPLSDTVKSETGIDAIGQPYSHPTSVTISNLSATSGTASGGTAITVTGSGFYYPVQRSWDNSTWTTVTPTDSNHFAFTTESHTSGLQTLYLQNCDAATGSKTSAFTYLSSFNLTIASTNGTTSPSIGINPEDSNSTVSISQITNNPGYRFWKWTRTTSSPVSTIADSTQSSTTITVNGNITVTANDTILPYTLNMVNSSPAGTISPTAGTHIEDTAASFSITYTPPSAWNFWKWGRSNNNAIVLDSTQSSTTAYLKGNASITAYDTVIPPPHLISVTPTSGRPLSILTAFGHHFGTTRGTSYLMLNSINLGATATWNDSTVVDTVPFGSLRGYYDFKIVTITGRDSLHYGYRVKTPSLSGGE